MVHVVLGPNRDFVYPQTRKSFEITYTNCHNGWYYKMRTIGLVSQNRTRLRNNIHDITWNIKYYIYVYDVVQVTLGET